MTRPYHPRNFPPPVPPLTEDELFIGYGALDALACLDGMHHQECPHWLAKPGLDAMVSDPAPSDMVAAAATERMTAG